MLPKTNYPAELRSQLKGHVIGPDEAGYDEARGVFYGGFDRRPAVVARAANASDVARVIAFARRTGLELAVRSGGHSVAGHSASEGGLVLDLGDMKNLEIDVDQRTAWAEPGLTAAEYSVRADAHGLATSFGDTGSVGIGGITLGGGAGYLARKYGLTIDHLLAAEVVTAAGQTLQVDAENHPDLFWAIRGGGGNFGVATRFKLRLHALDAVVGGMLFLPATPDVITGFVAAAEAAPEELSGIANIMPAPPMPFLPADQHGRMVIMALMCYAGQVQAGQRALAPFRALATPIADMLRPIHYPEMFPPEDPNYHPTAAGRTLFLDTVDHDTAQMIVDTLQASDAPFRVVQLRVLGGAVARVPAEATAYAHRARRIMANVAAFYQGPPDRPAREAWVIDFAEALQPGERRAYVGFLGEDGAARIDEAYPGATGERLRQIKAHYDPENLFHLNHNIVPARG